MIIQCEERRSKIFDFAKMKLQFRILKAYMFDFVHIERKRVQSQFVVNHSWKLQQCCCDV